MNIRYTLLLSLICLNIISCNFQWKLFKNLIQKNSDQNIIISPTSIWQTLVTTMMGSNDLTRVNLEKFWEEEMSSTLTEKIETVKQMIKETPEYNQLNAILTGVTPKESFIQIANKHKILATAIQNVEQINTIMSAVAFDTLLPFSDSVKNINFLLLSAVYYHSAWKFYFFCCTPGRFQNQDGELHDTDLMTIMLPKAKYLIDKEVEILEIPHKNEKISMMILLPHKTININDYVQALTEEKLYSYLKVLSTENIEVFLPRFTIETSFAIRTSLMDLGLVHSFDSSKAEFLNISENLNIAPEDFIQKIKIKIDETGGSKEATKEYKLLKKESSFIHKNFYNMVIDRPFVFILRHPDIDHFLIMAKIEKLE